MAESRQEMATRHVAVARRIVDQQRLLLERLKTNGRSTNDAERLLDLYERSLLIFENDLGSIIAQQNN